MFLELIVSLCDWITGMNVNEADITGRNIFGLFGFHNSTSFKPLCE